MTLAARLTAPLAGADDALNAMSDATNRAVPWMWWPLDPPARHAPFGAPHLTLCAVWAVGVEALYATALPDDLKPESPRRRRVERTLALGFNTLLTVAVAGACDRRAARLRRRRPWLRLT